MYHIVPEFDVSMCKNMISALESLIRDVDAGVETGTQAEFW